MKIRFNTYDIVCSVTELQRLVGMRVNQVYDIDHKTYLIKLHRSEEKCVLLLESGNRFHTTGFEWPKNVAPSGFSMKLRKHLKNKRLESMKQMGLDRIVDFQFGTGEAAYHVILELYDRGNIILCDYEMTILNILRPHVEGEKIKFAVREKYPIDRARAREENINAEKVKLFFENAKVGDNLKKILNPNLDYGPAIIDHVLLQVGLGSTKFGKGFTLENDLDKLVNALQEAERIITQGLKEKSKGYIVQKCEKRPLPDGGEEEFFTNQEFHPMKFTQHENLHLKEFETFDQAVDEFFSQFESQKIDIKTLQQEREALKKLANVRKDHEQRLEALEATQELDMKKADLITRNQELVDEAILAVRSLIAAQTSWPDIEEIIKEATVAGDAKAACITGLKLNINHITLRLNDPYFDEDEDENDDEEPELPSMNIDIDLDLSAYANARRYYDQKRSAAKKQQKTIESTTKALKSAERKTKQTLKEMKVIRNINKARKVYWFEKFFWFISSENYLVIGGRDQQQNELIVKRYMTQNDIYVHADIQGASSVIIKNPTGQPIPPKTLNESGVMAVCYSVAWDAKVLTNAWWVYSHQVSKTAPTGEYLQTGSFMIRGKKNYLLPANLIMGFSFLFKLEDSSISRHKDERKVRTKEEETSSVSSFNEELEQEIDLGNSSGDDDDDNDIKQENVKKEKLINLDDISEELTNIEEENEQKSDKSVEDRQNVEINSNNDDKEDDDDDDNDEQSRIPPFEGIKLYEEQIDIENKTANKTNNTINQLLIENENSVIVKSKPTRQKQNVKSNKKANQKAKEIQHLNINEEKEEKKDNQIKRGQKAKLKKIKEKYKYQDEEERKLRMAILQSAGNNKKGKNNITKENVTETNTTNKTKKPNNIVPRNVNVPEIKEGDEDGDDEPTVADDIDMVDSLTGQPVIEDEILFAIPVVAPYSTLQSYKFKVKLTPGTGKRGKAARTALTIFCNDKTTTQREKDLIRSVKDANMAINMPGKVKVSAPQLLKNKK